MQPGTSLLKLLLKSCTTNSFQDLVFHQIFTTIKVLSLKTSCFITWKSYVMLSTQELHPTTQKEMVKSNNSIELSCQCSEHFLNHTSPIGKNISTKLFMLTTVLGMNQLVIHHSISSSVITLAFQLILSLTSSPRWRINHTQNM